MANGIDLLIARGPAPVDFASGIGDLPKSYWEGLTQAHTQEQRDLFKQGLPTDPRDPTGKTTDYLEMIKRIIQQGGAAPGTALIPALQRQQLLEQPTPYDRANMSGGAAPSSQGAPVGQGAPIQRRPLAPEEPGPFSRSNQTLGGLVLRTTGGNEQAAKPVADRLARELNINPDTYLSPEDVIRVGQALRPQSTQAQPVQAPVQTGNPAQPISPNALIDAPQIDQTLGGRFPGGYQPALKILQNEYNRHSLLNSPETAKLIKDRIDAIDKTVNVFTEQALKAAQPTEMQKEYKDARRQGFTGTQEQFKEQRELGPKLTEPAIARVSGKGYEEAKGLVSGIKFSHDLMDQLNRKGGIFSGWMADQQLTLAKGLKAVADTVGISYDGSKIASTETFKALGGRLVAATVKSFGSGTSITDSDREYAKQMNAGDIKLDENSMRRVFVLTDKINRDNIQRHNEELDKLAKTKPWMKNDLEQYRVPEPKQNIMFQAYDAVYHGANPNAVRAELRKHGIKNPAGL